MDRLTFAATATLEGNTLSGRAYTYGQVTRDGRNHTFAKGAFDRALETSDPRSFWQHDPRFLLGRKSTGTLRVIPGPLGLDYEIDLPETTYAADIKALVERGDLTDMSFGVTPGATSRQRTPEGKLLIVHTSVQDLFDISPVSIGSFAGTTVQLHSAGYGSLRGQAILARHRARTEYTR